MSTLASLPDVLVAPLPLLSSLPLPLPSVALTAPCLLLLSPEFFLKCLAASNSATLAW